MIIFFDFPFPGLPFYGKFYSFFFFSFIVNSFYHYSGDVKEVKENTWKPQQRFIEFYDIRDAARAVTELHGKEVYGRRLVVEFTCTAGLSKRLIFNLII